MCPLPALIDVVIPAYNAGAFIAEALDSLLAQRVDLHVIVVDDGSTDDTAAVVGRYLLEGRVSYLHQPNSGLTGPPRNRGLLEVTAPYLAFFDADDVMQPGHLARCLELLQGHDEWIAVLGDYRNFSAKGDSPTTHFQTCPQLSAELARTLPADAQPTGPAPDWVDFDGVEARLLLTQENFSITGAEVFRTDVIRAIHGVDEFLASSTDFDLFWRATLKGPIGLSTHLAFRRRLHGTNLTNNQLKALRWKAFSRQKLLAVEPDEAVRVSLRRSIARFLDDAAAEQMPKDRRGGVTLLCESLGYGLPFRQWPRAGFRAWVKSCLRRAR